MRAVTTMGLCCAMLAACADDESAATAGRAPTLSGQWSVMAAGGPRSQGAVLGGLFTLWPDRSWRLRYDYRSEDGRQVWSAGLSGYWELQPGEPLAVRFEVIDDGSMGVGVLRDAHAMDVSLSGLALRLVRVPE